MEVLLLILGIIVFLALLDVVALRWGKDSRETSATPEWMHHHPHASI